MSKLPTLNQITRAARMRFGRFILAIRIWWHEGRADPDRRTNLLFLYTCSLLTAATIGSFLWLTGILDWRGSNGRTDVTLVFNCEGKRGDADYDACATALESDTQISARLDLQPRYETRSISISTADWTAATAFGLC
jgi:hypothetical protein